MSNFNLFFVVNIIISVFPFDYNAFKFSIIMPIYNTGKYLNDSISSLLNQSLGFNKIQLILINDGSLDNTHEICTKYISQYPDNIIYIRIEHGGVSKARNIGLEFAKGKYINFLDPDDFWDSKAFYFILNFFSQHKNISLVACRMKFFEARNKYHILDYKFIKTKIVNLIDHYKYIQLSASSCIFRAKAIKNLKFSEQIKYSEDILFINTLLLYNPKIGYIKEALYNYRSRKDRSSALQTINYDKSFYFNTLLNVHYFLMNLSISLYNKIVPFIQYFLIYDIQFRIRTNTQKYLSFLNIIKYKEMLNKILNCIDEKYILTQKYLPNIIKLLILSKKYRKDIRNDLIFKNNSLKYKWKTVLNFSHYKNIINWRIIDIKNDTLHIEGKDNCWIERDKYFYYAAIGNEIYYPEYKYNVEYNLNTLYGDIIKGRYIIFNIHIKMFEKQVIHIYISYLKNIIEIFPTYDFFSYIPPTPNGYYVSGNFILRNEDRNLIIYKYTRKRENLFEKQYIEDLKFLKKEYLIKLREHKKCYKTKIDKNKKEIWLINDGLNEAGDNGEYFFRYINENKKELINSYFIISENSNDYKRLKNIGNVISCNSEEYLVKYLMADKIISSAYIPIIFNPFGEDKLYICDLLQFQYIYLQHLIFNDDFFSNLQKLNKTFKMIITDSKKEYRFFISQNYGDYEYNIKLTGFSRYDNLQKIKNEKKKEKLILVIPTWRNNIKGTFDFLSYTSIYSHNFKTSHYFEFYNNLINNKNLLKTMNKLNYKGYFFLHPYFSSQYVDFTQNSIFEIKASFNYQELLSKGSLVITDYSTVSFDFAYMKKPIIYTQFDLEEYIKNKNKNSYFDYIKDGFGPIYYDIDQSVKGIIESIENDCPLKNKYLRRIQKYFTYLDDKNNIRIYNAITGKLTKNKKFHKNGIYIFHLILIFLFFFKIFYLINNIVRY